MNPKYTDLLFELFDSIDGVEDMEAEAALVSDILDVIVNYTVDEISDAQLIHPSDILDLVKERYA